MPTRDLPARPNLAQLKLQAKELQRAHSEGNRAAAARIAAHHPRLKGRSLESALGDPLTLTDAQLVLAREYGFPSWARLRHHVEIARRLAKLEPHPRFDEALVALDAGDAERLRGLIASDSSLLSARTNLDARYGYFAGATLLHHVAGNPTREVPLPANVVDVARALLEAGADANAETLGPNSGTTMGLLLTSKQASDLGVTGPLVDLLLQFGSGLELEGPDVLDSALANHAPRAAEKLIELGAKPDLLAAAALGRIELLRASFDGNGRLLARPRRHGRTLSERDAIGLALLCAYVRAKAEAVDFLLEKEGNWSVTGVSNGTALHRAASEGDLAMVQRLVARGADLSNRENPFHATPLSWAVHAGQKDVFEWIRRHCSIDLHDAVCMDLLEHVEARLAEDPEAVNRRLNQWNLPHSTPLHWAARLYGTTGDPADARDPSRGVELAALLLDRGADPNLIAGNGLTPLDLALESRAEGIAALLERRGGKRAADL